MFWPESVDSFSSYNLNTCVRIKMLDTYYSGSSTSDRYACMYACDIHIISFWGFFLSQVYGDLENLSLVYVANLRGEYTCTCVVFFFFFFSSEQDTCSVTHASTGHGWERLFLIGRQWL